MPSALTSRPKRWKKNIREISCCLSMASTVGVVVSYIYIPFTFPLYASFVIVIWSSCVREFPMTRKRPSPPARTKRRSTSTRSRAAEARTRPAETRNNNEDLSGDELTDLVVRGCLIARDSVFNVRNFLADRSRRAFLAIQDCAKELNQIVRKLNEHLP